MFSVLNVWCWLVLSAVFSSFFSFYTLVLMCSMSVSHFCFMSSLTEDIEAFVTHALWLIVDYWYHFRQGDHLSGKPGNVRDSDSCHGHVRDFTNSQGSVREKNLVREKKLFIVSCIFASILDFAEFVHFILVSDHAL